MLLEKGRKSDASLIWLHLSFGILNYPFVLSSPTFLTTVGTETARYELLIKMKNVKLSVTLLVSALRKG